MKEKWIIMHDMRIIFLWLHRVLQIFDVLLKNLCLLMDYAVTSNSCIMPFISPTTSILS